MPRKKGTHAAKPGKQVAALTHPEARRTNIPSAEQQAFLRAEEMSPLRVEYERRNPDLDPQLVWRGKDVLDWSDLVVSAPPVYIQEKVHPKALVDDLIRQRERRDGPQIDLFADFNGLPSEAAKTEFYQHPANWSNRMILGDSLQVMASLAEREGLRGKVQMIYLDPPYGIKFNSNFQWSTTSRDVKDGNAAHITREPEQVKAFRDTWRDGIHSYLTYLRDRLTVARDLLTESGSIFVQIGDGNVHRVRSLLDEVLGAGSCISQIAFAKTTSSTDAFLGQTTDYLLWYARNPALAKFRALLRPKRPGEKGGTNYGRLRDKLGGRCQPGDPDGNVYTLDNLTSQRPPGDFPVTYQGDTYRPTRGYWKTNEPGMARLGRAGRLEATASRLGYVRYLWDFPAFQVANRWDDVGASFMADKSYVVQTAQGVVERCVLMATDPGDLVLDPTCGSGTTAHAAERRGRRWITIDTSRVALALARARLMGARYPYYILADSREGQLKEAEITGRAPAETPTSGDLRQGFVYERVPHITLKSIAQNAEIDVIWEEFQRTLEPLREKLNRLLKESWEDWQIPREAEPKWPATAKEAHAAWWKARIERQKKIDASIAAKADTEYLYDRPYQDNKTVRVAGPFTVESLSPHRVLAVNEDDELVEPLGADDGDPRRADNFTQLILENLRTAGVQQAHKDDKITFTTLAPWPGRYVCAEGSYSAVGGKPRRAGVLVGPEFGSLSRPDLVAAAREAGDAGFDALIACAFNYDAQSSELASLGRIPILKARMNADLHMAGDLKNTGKGNLFVIFGEPEIEIIPAGREDGTEMLRVKIKGVDVFDPSTGDVRSDNAEGIALWFIDTDYNEESFFVRHAYFLGANDPYKSLKTSLRAEIDESAWASLHSDISRPFPRPGSGRIAVKVINHLGDEVMKTFRV